MKNHLCNLKIFFLYLVLVLSPVLTNAQTYTLKNANIGGGGFVTGIISHKKSGDKYCRTDVGGAYRWDASNNKWVQLLDWLNESESGFIGVEALALDPQNANNVYMLCGTEYMNNGRTAILKSTDKGNTFTYTDVTSKFKAHGNGFGRGNGERLAVDPKNSNILFCGTRSNGLWKSTDGGVTWNQTWSGVTTTTNGNGICFVQFDPSGNVVNGASQTIYIGVSRTGKGNVYKSTDGGATFTDISPNNGFMPHRVALQGTTMYATLSVEQGPSVSDYSKATPANDMGRVYKLNTSTGVWTNVTPAHHPTAKYPYGGVSIDPSNSNRILVSTCGMYWNNQYGGGWGDFVFLSADGGSTWTLKNGTNATYNNNGMAWTGDGAVNWMDSIDFDPANSSVVRVIGGGGVYTCPDIAAANPSWKCDVIGIEETALLDGVSIPGGPFISSFGDVTGFVHDPLTSFPSAKLSPADKNNQSIAYAAGNTNKVVRASDRASVIYYSVNKGATWTASATNKGTNGMVDISADGKTILHCPGGSTTTWYTTNDGGSWSGCSGVSVGNAIPVADQINSNYFYIYNPSNGQILRSSNKGVSFSIAGTPGINTIPTWELTTLIRTTPGFEGHVWVPLGGNGLKYSTDHGATYTTLSNVPYCRTVGIGKAIAGASYPTIFIWGTVSGNTGLFRSTDQGATWLRMNDDAHEFGGTSILIGDMNVDGRVYMSAAGGRGLIYWDPVPAVTYVTLANRTTGLRIDGMGKTTDNSNCGQWSSGESVNQQWIIETVGNYVMLKNRASGLYLDGMYRKSNGSVVGQYSYSGTDAQYWTRETVGSYVKFKNKATGLYLDGMGIKTNGADLGQWAASTHNNQQWTITTVGNGQTAKMGSMSTDDIAEESNFSIDFYPNPFTNDFKVVATKSNEPIRVSIFDMTGKKVETAESSSESGQLLMGSSLTPGLYIVQVEGVNLNFSKSFKIIKK